VWCVNGFRILTLHGSLNIDPYRSLGLSEAVTDRLLVGLLPDCSFVVAKIRGRA
jgi:hypothetical protein